MIYIGSDKHGYTVFSFIENYLKSHSIPYVNLGVQDKNEDINLEKLIPLVINKVLEDSDNQAFLSCGTGVGVEIGANKFAGIRASLVVNSKIAEYARVYDNCNVACFVGWETKEDDVINILDTWFASKYDGSQKRLEMFKEFDKWH